MSFPGTSDGKKRPLAMRETRVWSLGWEDPMKKEMATHCITLAWKTPWMEEPHRLQSMGSQRVRHNWVTSVFLGVSAVKYPPAKQESGFDPWVGEIPWRRKWQPTPVFLPRKSHGQRSLVGYRPWGCKESDITEQLSTWHRKQTEGLDALLLKTPDTIFL